MAHRCIGLVAEALKLFLSVALLSQTGVLVHREEALLRRSHLGLPLPQEALHLLEIVHQNLA